MPISLSKLGQRRSNSALQFGSFVQIAEASISVKNSIHILRVPALFADLLFMTCHSSMESLSVLIARLWSVCMCFLILQACPNSCGVRLFDTLPGYTTVPLLTPWTVSHLTKHSLVALLTCLAFVTGALLSGCMTTQSPSWTHECAKAAGLALTLSHVLIRSTFPLHATLLSSVTFILAWLHGSRGSRSSFQGLSMSSVPRRSLLGNPQNFRLLFYHLHYHLCKF